MKAFLLVLAIGLTAAILTEDGPGIQPGKEYVYKYETRIISAIMPNDKAISALKVVAEARLLVKNHQKMMVKLTNVEVLKMVTEIEAPSFRKVPEEALPWRPLEEPQRSIMIEQITKPIKFKYVEGRVMRVMAPADEPYWSLNVKKGVLNMLQLDLTGKNAIPDHAHDPLIEDELISNDINVELKTDEAFATMEEGVDGICKTLYGVRKELLQPADELRVTKVKDTKYCKAKPKWMQGIFTSAACPKCEQIIKKDLVESIVYANYNITGTRFNPLVKDCVYESKHTFTPYKFDKGSALIETMQVLRLVDVRELGEVEVPRNLVPINEGLLMIIPNPLINSPVSEINPEIDSSIKIQKIEETLAKIEEAVTPITQPTAPLLIAELVTILRECTTEELAAIIKPVVMTGDMTSKKRDLLLHILPAIGTPDSIPVLIDVVSSNSISKFRATILITTMATTATPTPETINQLIRLYKDLAAESGPTGPGMFRRSVILAAGALTHRLVTLQKNVIWNKAIITSARKSLATEIVALLKSATETKERIAILKAIGNAGLVEFLPELQKVIKSRDIPASVRIEAVYALRKIAPVASMNTMQVVAPIIMDFRAPTKLRMAAFVVATETKLKPVVLKTMVSRAEMEPNSEMKSLIITYLRNIVHSRFPCHREIKSAARNVLTFITPVRTSVLSSNIYSSTRYYERLDIGSAIEFIAKKSARSIPYEDIAAKIETIISGKKLNLFEAGIQTEGIQAIIRRLLGPNTALSEVVRMIPELLSKPEIIREALGDVFNRNSRIYREGSDFLARLFEPLTRPSYGEAEPEIKRIIEKIDIKERAMDDVLMGAFVRVFGNELTFISLEKEDIAEMFNSVMMHWETIQELISNGGTPYTQLHTLPLVENSLVLPTPTGFPVTLNLTVVTLMNAEGIIKVETPGASIDSLIRSAITNRAIPEAVVKCTTEVTPSAAVAVIGSLGVDAYVAKVGAAVQALVKVAAPATKAVFGIDTKVMKVFADYKLPKHEQEFLYVKVSNPVYVHPVPYHFASLEKIDTIDIRTTKEIHFEHMVDVEKEVLGLPMLYTGKIEIPVASWSPIAPLNSRIEIRGRIVPSADTPDVLTIQAMTCIPTEEIIREGMTEVEIIKAPLAEEETIIIKKKPKSWLSSWWSKTEEEEELSRSSSEEEDTLMGKILKEKERRRAGIYRGMGFRSRGLYSVESLLEDIELSEIASPAMKANLYMVAKTYGGRREGRADAKFTWMASKNFMKHAVVTQVTRTPYSSEAEPWKVKVKSIVNLNIASPEARTIVDAEVKMGPVSAIRKVVDVKVEKDEALASWPHGVAPKTEVNPVGIVGRIKFSEELPYVVRSAALKALNAFKAYMYEKVSVELPDPELANINKVEIFAKVIPVLKRLDIMMKTPYETLIMPQLKVCPLFLPKVPSEIVPYLEREEWEALKASPYDSLITNVIPNVCVVKTNGAVSTFDGVTFDLPKTECEILLAKDCSPQRLFVITAEPVASAPEMKIVKIVVPGHHIKIVPSAYGTAEIIINGRRPSLPLVIKDESSGAVLLEVVKEVKMIKVIIKKFGINVLSSGTKIITKVSPVFYGTTCGICGDYNGEVSTELMGPAMNLFEEPEKFVYSYLLPTDTCRPEEIHLRHGLHHLTATSRCEKLRNKVITRDRLGKKEVCISTEPLKKCGDACSPALVREARVEFHCMPGYSSLARTLLEEHHARPLEEMREKPVDHVEILSVPTKCVPAY